MINAIIGKPRSGKSYEAARYHALEAIKSGRMVVTNLSLNVDYICSILGEESRSLIVVIKQDFSNFDGKSTDYYFSKPEHFTNHDWKDDDSKGPLFIVDEAHFVFSGECTKEILKYLAMHGHYGHDILMLTQDGSQLHRTIRKMVDVGYRTIKLSMVGQDKQYKRKVYSGISMRNADYMNEETRVYDPKYFKLYQSHTLSSGSVNEASATDVKGGGFNPSKKKTIAICIVGLLLSIFAFKGLFTPKEKVVVKSEPIKEFKKPIKGSPSPVIKEVDRALEKNNRHPFDKVKLHIVGRVDIRGGGRVVDLIEFDASKSGNVLFQIDSVDLLRAGYEVEAYSDCSVRLTHRNYTDFIICDSPDQAAQETGNVVAGVLE